METTPTSAPRAAVSTTATSGRLAALDWMRGIVMVLMAVDHSSEAFNAGRLFTDSVFFYQPGTPLPVLQFLTRFITHLCAPTFVFLAGTGLAFTVHRQLVRGASSLAIDRHIALRGAIIAGFELWISWFVVPPGIWLLQVLYAIGVSFIFMVPLRRLSNHAALALALFIIVAGEALVGVSVAGDPAHVPLVLALLVVGGERPPVIIGYPPLHWLAIMLLGWVFGRMLVAKTLSAARVAQMLALLGTGSVLAFVVLRGLNGYGNMLLLREDHSLVQWLHVSKYPPSITYTTLELGIMALIMATLFQLSRVRAASRDGVLSTLGRTPMFFYLLHFPLLVWAGRISGVQHELGLVATYVGAAGVVIVLYPACRWYAAYKGSGRHAWTQYV